MAHGARGNLPPLAALGLAVLLSFPVAVAAVPGVHGLPAAPPALAAAGALPDLCGHGGAAAHPRDPALVGPLPQAQALPEPTALLGSCTGIRPGAQLGNGCTMNFVFADAADLYIGTAGHCTSSLGQRMSASGVGEFGSVVYRINGGLGSDFALIRIDAAKHALVSPTLCVWGGPAGAHAGTAQVGDVLYEYGWGIATLWTPPTRARVLASQSQGVNSVAWIGVGSGGDSGAPVVTEDLRAYAIHTHGITPIAGVVGESGTYIHRALGLARNAGFQVQLVPGNV